VSVTLQTQGRAGAERVRVDPASVERPRELQCPSPCRVALALGRWSVSAPSATIALAIDQDQGLVAHRPSLAATATGATLVSLAGASVLASVVILSTRPSSGGMFSGLYSVGVGELALGAALLFAIPGVLLLDRGQRGRIELAPPERESRRAAVTPR
jgi:hypothetical protein